MKTLRVDAVESKQYTHKDYLIEIILIQSDIYGRCDIGVDLAKLKKLKLLWMTEEKIDTHYQMFGPVSEVSEL